MDMKPTPAPEPSGEPQPTHMCKDCYAPIWNAGHGWRSRLSFKCDAREDGGHRPGDAYPAASPSVCSESAQGHKFDDNGHCENCLVYSAEHDNYGVSQPLTLESVVPTREKVLKDALRDVLLIIANEPELDAVPTREEEDMLARTPRVDIARAAVKATKAAIFDKARLRSLLVFGEES